MAIPCNLIFFFLNTLPISGAHKKFSQACLQLRMMFNGLFLATTFHLSASPLFCTTTFTISKAEVKGWESMSTNTYHSDLP